MSSTNKKYYKPLYKCRLCNGMYSDNTVYHAENAEEIDVNKIPLKKHKCSIGIKKALGITEVVAIAEMEEK